MCISNVGFNYFSKRFFDSLKRDNPQCVTRAEADDKAFLFFGIRHTAVTKQCLRTDEVFNVKLNAILVQYCHKAGY